MDKIQKALEKLSEKEREAIKKGLQALKDGKTKGLDISRLKGYHDIYRLRKGRVRVIFRLYGGDIVLLKIDRRCDTTYSDF